MFSKLLAPIKKPSFLGIDISDLSIKFLRVDKEGRGNGKKITRSGEVAIGPGLVSGGDIKDETGLAEALKNSLRDEKGRRLPEKFVVASLPEEKSFVRMVQLPKLSREEIPTAAKWELESNIPFPIEQVYFDYEVVYPAANDEKADHTDILVTAFPRLIVDSYVSVLKGAGLYPLSLELESQAISRAVISPAMLKESLIIIDLGMTRTSFIIFGGGSITLTLSVALGGRDFSRAISEKLKITLEEAELIKKQYGLDKNYKNGILADALTPHLASLAEHIKKQIWFLREHPEHRHGSAGEISRVLLVGGDANLIGIEKHLSVALKIPVEVADPFINVYGGSYKSIPPIPKNSSLKYTTAVGLALRDN